MSLRWRRCALGTPPQWRRLPIPRFLAALGTTLRGVGVRSGARACACLRTSRRNMAQGIKVGIIGGGWPGGAHARGYKEAGGFKVVAVADLIPSRRTKLKEMTGATREYA